jgi:hypothetical protein
MNELKRKDLEEVLELLINENTTHLGLKIAEERFDCKLLTRQGYGRQPLINMRACYFMSFEGKEICFVLGDEESFELDTYIYSMSTSVPRFLYGELYFLIYLPC